FRTAFGLILQSTNFPTTILETLPPYRELINQQNMIPVDLDDLLTSELTSSVYYRVWHSR
ncbi:hypothetical protein KNO47_05780, partial [Latilactobacillus curvatus]|uniref:hypothetical protein n=1 Tax=Latilactobacillus curvatus TaxID=28038 RepID=UPI0024107ED0